jgi:hypothetical protein
MNSGFNISDTNKAVEKYSRFYINLFIFRMYNVGSILEFHLVSFPEAHYQGLSRLAQDPSSRRDGFLRLLRYVESVHKHRFTR